MEEYYAAGAALHPNVNEEVERATCRNAHLGKTRRPETADSLKVHLFSPLIGPQRSEPTPT
eukprot:9448294-Heterocapsa_arctica.AAC.1